MNRNILVILTAAILMGASLQSSFDKKPNPGESAAKENPPYDLQSLMRFDESNYNLPAIEEKRSGPEMEKYYFERWHYPGGAMLDQEVLERIWDQIGSMPSEPVASEDDVNSWRLWGPYGSDVPATTGKFSGRVRDIEIGNSANPIVAAASGGLWSYFWILPYCLNEDMSSLACGSFATMPGNASTLVLGTGEPRRRTGTGLYRSSNSGSNWSRIGLTPEPSAFYRIRYDNNFSNRIHAASTAGYYRSTNNGYNWTRTLTGEISDIAINAVTTEKIYAGKWGDGIYKSTNNGVNWTKLTSPGLPASDIGRISLALGTSNTNKVYAAISKNSDNTMLGIYVSTNDGASWTDVSPPENIFGNQGWYNSVVGVCPTNSNIALLGGVRMWRTTNSGTSWTKLESDNIHADQHVVEWADDGQTVYIGNDGGIAASTDQGQTFSNTSNYFPITQYVNFDVGVSNRGVIYGGSQDNGFTGSTNGGTSWIFTKGGDGGGVAIDPFNSLYIYGTAGAYNGNWKFRRYRSTDRGLTWDTTNTGVDPADTWYTKMRSDRTSPITLYTNSGKYVYYSTNQGDSWTKLNPSIFPVDVENISVTKESLFSEAVVYACLGSSGSGQRLRVYDNGTWYERSSGLPSGLKVNTVATHISSTTKAYALMTGTTDGSKVYKTTNRGANWTNITGNLPNVPVGDLVPHPTNDNLLYLGTEMGCYKTTNGGQQWIRWNNGMPEAAIVTEMKWIDSTFENGKFYVVAGTYGRSFYLRDIAGDDPVNTLSLTCLIQGFYSPSSNQTIADTIRAYLRSSFFPYEVIDSASGVMSSNGSLDMKFFYSQPSVSYYIQLKHRNGLETWSANTISFSNFAASYDFTTDDSKAFGDNQRELDRSPVEYGLFGGDVNQDGTIDATDGQLVDNDAFAIVSGYVATDVNGDEIVDGSDQLIVENNSMNFVSVMRP